MSKSQEKNPSNRQIQPLINCDEKIESFESWVPHQEGLKSCLCWKIPKAQRYFFAMDVKVQRSDSREVPRAQFRPKNSKRKLETVTVISGKIND